MNSLKNEMKIKLDQLNKQRINQAAYGITSINKIIAAVNRHKSEGIPLDDAEIKAVFNLTVMGGLQVAIEELATEIDALSEPTLDEIIKES